MGNSLLHPDEFNAEHQAFIDELRQAITALSEQAEVVCGMKDVESRNIIASNAAARLFGLKDGRDVEGLLDRDMPCEGTARFADDYVSEDREVMAHADDDGHLAVLAIQEFANGIKGFVCEKQALVHPGSGSVLGTLFASQEVDLSDFLAVLPHHFDAFGIGAQWVAPRTAVLSGTAPTEFEHEVTFLIGAGWQSDEIARFMSHHRPGTIAQEPEGVERCAREVAAQLGLPGGDMGALRAKLISMGVHRKVPRTLFRRLYGRRPLRDKQLLADMLLHGMRH